jgi:cob(I)alamin adenosyltransferase
MLYTKKGDTGTTKLFDCQQGQRVYKNELIFEALGTIDELNSCLGYAKALSKKYNIFLELGNQSKTLGEILEILQNNLFSIQAELGGSQGTIKENHVLKEEEIIAQVEIQIPPITTFLIPGGDELSAYLDVCRTISRRAERLVVSTYLQDKKRVSEFTLQYLNRLSSVLYALARLTNHKNDYKEKPPTYG